MRRLLAAAALALVAAGFGGCFNPDKPTCSYACSDTDPKCPDDYECRSDGYCHLVGTTGACAYPPLDMSVTLDLGGPDLLSTSD